MREGRFAPLIDGALGWIEARTRAEHEAGDHTFFIADAVAVERGPARTRAHVPRSQLPLPVIEAVVFDLDGVLIHSEEVWDEVREAYVRERGGRYDAEVQRAMMGMSSTEWSRYLHETAGVPDEPDAINAEVVRRMLERVSRASAADRRCRRRRAAPRCALPARARVLVQPAADRRGARNCRTHVVLQGDRLLRGGRTRQAGAGRLPRGRATPRRRRGPRAPPWRTRTAASARRRPPACA